MYRVKTRITFTQLKSYRDVNGIMQARNGTLLFNFCHEFNVKTSWNTLTDDGEITLPKNIYVLDKNGVKTNLGSTNINIGGFVASPYFLRGDKVKIESGYIYYDRSGNELAPMKNVFEGYISDVTSKKPFVIKVQDNMYLLKETPAVGLNGRKFFSGKTYKVEDILREMFKSNGLNFTVNAITGTTISDVIVQTESIAQFLERLRKEYHFESYFQGTELRVGSQPYLPSDNVGKPKIVFKFQQNIISEDLEYRRKDDIILSAVIKNTQDVATGATTKDGQAKTKKQKTEILITFQNGSAVPTIVIGTKGNPLPANTGGERHDFYFSGTQAEMIAKGTDKLRSYYYTGFKGKFTGFGIPYAVFGDNIDLLDAKLPERNGRYKVKSVEYSGGVNGNRQVIELDYLIGLLDAKGNFIGLK
jgi:hypothetical protein